MIWSETQVIRLALSSHEAAAHPELWPQFLKGCVETVSADSAILQIHDFRKRKSTILEGFGLTAGLKDSYNEYYGKINIWRNQGFASRKYAAGKTTVDYELCPRPVLEGTEFYNDCLYPMNVIHSMGSVIALHDDRAPSLTFLRGRHKPGFGEEERKFANLLLPHLMRAWSVYQRLNVLAAGERVLDGLPYGVLFLTSIGSIAYCNRCGETVLREGDGLSIREGRLHAADSGANAVLQNMIARAAGAGTPAAGVRILRPSCRRAYQVVGAPLRGSFPQFAGMVSPSVVVFIFDPECVKPTQLDLLTQLYSLTPTEAQMAQKLSQGKTVEQAAVEMQIRYETARTHLRRIFSKTQTSRQSELILMLSRLPMEAD